MKNLPTTLITQPTPMVSAPPAITWPVPISYEFRVVEYTELDKITKVRMEVKTFHHDQYGNTTYESMWEEVPRVQIALDVE